MLPIFQAWLQSEDGKVVAIPGSISLGRSTSNTIVLASEKVSRRHAIINAQNQGEFWLVDLGSSNGTYVNDRRINLPVKLKDQDRVAIGRHLFTFRQKGTAPDIELTNPEASVREFRSQSVWLLVADIENFSLLSQRLEIDRLATVVGAWMLNCKNLVEDHGGVINKYVGDGFLAHWPDTEACAPLIGAMTKELLTRSTQEPRFRTVLHRGEVSVSGSPLAGEELLGSEVNFTFRMEKLAGKLGVPLLLSEAASAKLPAQFPTRLIGYHQLQGFENHFNFFVP
jgi:adenylate cyclase